MKVIKSKSNIVGLKELRNNIETYIKKVDKGESFTVVRRSSPVFKVSPVDDENLWEEVIDFTKLKKGGVEIGEMISRL
ncbi:MAG: type II toxin-antitoxin system prevent-host-death family antitoxin [Patescibacteria group bacterium]